MAFDVRCPECKAKLRLDDAPEPGTSIECPRCGSQFRPPKKSTAASPAPSSEKSKPKRDKPRKGTSAEGGKKSKKSKKPKKMKMKKKKTNPVFLLAAIGFGFVGIILVGALMIWFVNRAGQVQDMLSYVPKEFNWVRGVNVAQLNGYPGYADELNKFYTKPMQDSAKEFAKAAGLTDEADINTFVQYVLITRHNGVGGRTPPMTMIRFRSAIPEGGCSGITGAKVERSPGGQSFYRMNGTAPAFLRNQMVYITADGKTAIIRPAGTDAVTGVLRDGEAVDALAAVHTDLSRSLAGNLDETGKMVMRGNIWLLIRQTDGNKDWIGRQSAENLKEMSELAKKVANVPTFGMWTTPGGNGVRFGAAIQLSDAETAGALVDAMQEGKLGKGDESEPPNSMKSFRLFSSAKTKTELLQSLRFKSKGESAYINFTLTGPNAKEGMTLFNEPNLGLGGGGGGQGFPGGGGGGGVAEPGLPGGIVNPGMGP